MSDAVSNSFPDYLVSIGKLIEAAVSTQWVVLILVPGLTTAGAILLKACSRKTRTWDAGDSLFGFDLGVTACLTLMVSGFVLVNSTSSTMSPAERQQYIVGLFVVLLIFVGVLSGAAAYAHTSGWDDADPPKPKVSLWWLINGLGVGFLLAAFVLTGGTFR
jgi:hypothetical protein